MSQSPAAHLPHIVLILADNLGWGELGCYGGGALRGAPTPRIDRLAAEGLRLLNFNVESDCVPTRSALMTGRHPIRTGALQSVPAGLPQGLIPWEITLGAAVCRRRVTPPRCFGKWHLGDRDGRYPERSRLRRVVRHSAHHQREHVHQLAGLRSRRSCRCPTSWKARRASRRDNVQVYDLEARRRIDTELIAPHDRLHAPADQGRTAVLRLRAAHAAALTRRCRTPTSPARPAPAISPIRWPRWTTASGRCSMRSTRSASRDDTLVIFASDNGPEFRRPWRGTAGPWSGTYHTAMEGALRVPFMMRWPGRIAAGRRQQRDRARHRPLHDARARRRRGACRPTGRSTASTSSTSSSASRRNRTAKASSITSSRSCARRSGATGRCTSSGSPSPTRARTTSRRRGSST